MIGFFSRFVLYREYGSPPGFFFNAKSTSCGRGPSSELTPTASAASLGYAGLQAARRNTRFAHYCEEYTLADAFILTTNNHFPQII